MTTQKLEFSSDANEQAKLEELLKKSVVESDGLSAAELMDPQMRYSLE